MRRDRGRRRIYRSRALRRRRSALVLCVLAALAAVVVAAGQSGGSERVTYDRRAAAAYADTWALSTNPAYWSSPDDDCADFVSQCLAAGGLLPLTGAAGEWHENGSDFPTIAWVNCAAQMRTLSGHGQDHTSYIARVTMSLPRDWAAGDVVYLGNTVYGTAEWQHVIICVGRDHGQWLYDSRTTAHLRQPLEAWYPAHFSLIRYCHIADSVSYGVRR
jgi:hypothetical protein